MTISETVGFEDISVSEYNIFPKPIKNRMYVNGPTEHILSISIVSMGGAKVVDEANYSTSGIDVSSVRPGTYVVVLTTANGTYVDKVIKVQY